MGCPRKGKAAGEASEHCIGSSSVLVVKGLGAYADLWAQAVSW